MGSHAYFKADLLAGAVMFERLTRSGNRSLGSACTAATKRSRPEMYRDKCIVLYHLDQPEYGCPLTAFESGHNMPLFANDDDGAIGDKRTGDWRSLHRMK